MHSPASHCGSQCSRTEKFVPGFMFKERKYAIKILEILKRENTLNSLTLDTLKTTPVNLCSQSITVGGSSHFICDDVFIYYGIVYMEQLMEGWTARANIYRADWMQY